MSKPKWNQDQVQHLVETVCELRESDPEPSLLQIIKIAQELIFEPQDRRVIKQAQSVFDIIKMVKDRYGVEPKIVKFVDKYKELEERVQRIEQKLNVRKVKIAVAGLKLNQYHEIRKDNPDVELVFLDRDQNNPSFPSSVKYVVVMKDFIKHSYTSRLYNFYPKDKVIEIEGTVDSAKRKIFELSKGN
jgi:hypothetical protein